MNDFTKEPNICIKQKTFHPRNHDFGVSCVNHLWRIFVFDEVEKIGMAICTSCAKISGGWVKDE